MNSNKMPGRHAGSNPPRRILLVRNDRIGDLVLTLPAIEAVRHHWPEAHISALVSPYAGALVGDHPAIDELLYDDPDGGAWQLGKRLRTMSFDAAVVFNTSTRNCLAIWAARIPRRVCWAYKPIGWLTATDRVAVHRSHPPIHESQFALAFAHKLGAPVAAAGAIPQLPIDGAVRAAVITRLQSQLGSDGSLFGVHPGNKQSAYNWPASRYADLVCQLANFGRVMVTGTPAEQPLLDVIRGRLDAGTRWPVGFFTDWKIPELTAAIAEQDVLIVSSTGPMHLAGVVGTPCVALFSPHPAHVPAKWAPLGNHHTLLVAPLATGEDAQVPRERGTELMNRISVEQVLTAALKYSRGTAAAGAA